MRKGGRRGFRRQARGSRGSSVIWNRIPFGTRVIPAKAGIQSVGGVFVMACGVDSRLRGNDCTHESVCLANDTTAGAGVIVNRLHCP